MRQILKCNTCGKVEKSSIFSFGFYNDYDSFSFHKMNWRNFTIIHLAFETNGYSCYLEVEFGLLGLNFEFNIHRPYLETECSDCFSKRIKKSFHLAKPINEDDAKED